MVLATCVLFALVLANGILSFLTLTAVSRVFEQQRKDAEETRLALVWLTDVLSDLNESVESALSCLVSIDAELDAEQNPSETESFVE